MDAPENTQQATEKPQNMHDMVSAAFDQLEAESETEEVVEEVTEEVIEEVAEIEADGTHSDDEEVTETVDEETQELEAEAEADAEPEYDAPAPERWPQEMKDAYQELPANARKLMIENVFKPMQKTYTQTTQQLAEQRKMLEPMMQSMQQYSQNFDKAGVNPAEAFRQQMAWSAHIASVGPEQGLKDMAEAYGVGQQETSSDDQYLTPVERSMKQRLEQVENNLKQQASGSQQSQQARAAEIRNQQIASVKSELQQFVNATKDGKALHPHVEKVAQKMTGLINGGLVERNDEYGQPLPMQQQLGQAYKLACDLDPSIKALRTKRTRQEQVDKVKLANRSVVSKSPASQVAVDNRPLTDIISDNYDKLNR